MNRGLLNCQVALAAERPQLAPIILHLEFVESNHLPTMGVTESGIVHYNPTYIKDMTTRNLQDYILHEALHLFLDYFGRQEERESIKWNVAHDLEISNYVVPKGGLQPSQFNLPGGKGAEYYYTRIPTQPKKGTLSVCSQDSVLRGTEGPSESTIRAIVRTAEKIVEGSGAIGADTSLMRQALRIIRPGRPNSTLRALQGSMLVPGLTDVSYERPNRRTQGHMSNVVLPASMHREPNVLCILDVSGSMINHLERATHIVMSAVRSIGTNLMVVAWDTRPICMQNVRRAADLKKLKISGGGTNMAAAILAAPSYGKFDSVLVVTDGETPWPTKLEMRRIPPTHILLVKGESPPPTYLPTVSLSG